MLADMPPVLALTTESPRWWQNRVPGGRLPDPTGQPEGWRLGMAVTSPYSLGLDVAYTWPGELFQWRAGGTWGLRDDFGPVAFDWASGRVYGGLVYSLLPALTGGPYLEVGMGMMRTRGVVLDLGWPVLPQLGFGTSGRFNDTFAWDVTFTGIANRTLVLTGGLCF